MEFREMRRFRQKLNHEKCEKILSETNSGTLALLGDGGYPYAVPLSHVYSNGKIYFHSAKTGHKVDSVKACDKASFCVIAADDVKPSEFTTYFRSVIAFGRIHIVESEEERLFAATLLGEKFNPGDAVGLKKEIAKGLEHMLVFCLEIEHMSGKEAVELAKKV